jgi:hypothetical protein
MLVVSTLTPSLQVPKYFNFKDLFSGIVRSHSFAPNEYVICNVLESSNRGAQTNQVHAPKLQSASPHNSNIDPSILEILEAIMLLRMHERLVLKKMKSLIDVNHKF